jgi:glyoxylase-like metal-dependent hydrolase (beta-lactamase superfamily II)
MGTGGNYIEPPKLLFEIGVKSDEVQTVVVTHFHTDHFTGFDFFPKAEFVVHRTEFDFWMGPFMQHKYINKPMRPKVRPALERMNQEGRLRLVDGDFELHPGLELLGVGGHTPGFQMFAGDTTAGKAVICGDITYTYRNECRWDGTRTLPIPSQAWSAPSAPQFDPISPIPTMISKCCRENA